MGANSIDDRAGTEPLYIDPASGCFRLLADSPAATLNSTGTPPYAGSQGIASVSLARWDFGVDGDLQGWTVFGTLPVGDLVGLAFLAVLAAASGAVVLRRRQRNMGIYGGLVIS